MKYQVKEFVNEKYSKAINILKDNLKENYQSINSITLPLIIFEMNERKPVAIISFEQVAGSVFVGQFDINVLVVENLSELLTNETLDSLYN